MDARQSHPHPIQGFGGVPKDGAPRHGDAPTLNPGCDQQFLIFIHIVETNVRRPRLVAKTKAIKAGDLEIGGDVELFGGRHPVLIRDGGPVAMQNVTVGAAEGVVHLGDDHHQIAFVIAQLPKAHRVEDKAQHPRHGQHFNLKLRHLKSDLGLIQFRLQPG